MANNDYYYLPSVCIRVLSLLRRTQMMVVMHMKAVFQLPEDIKRGRCQRHLLACEIFN